MRSLFQAKLTFGSVLPPSSCEAISNQRMPAPHTKVEHCRVPSPAS